MVARYFRFQLKPNMAKELVPTFENEVLPFISKQKGFLDELLLITPEEREVVAISLWETEEHADTYHRGLYPQIEKVVGKFAMGTPFVKSFNTVYATFRKTASAATL